jgi:hypothetical protein
MPPHESGRRTATRLVAWGQYHADMSPPSSVRGLLRSWRCPVYESRNKVLGAPAAFNNLRFQREEVRRLGRQVLNGGRVEARVLVVIPTFKRPDGVVRAIESVLSQTFGELAIVVVDDGAGLPAELPSDPRLTAVSLSRNTATLGLVRNVAIHLANSEFIAFLDDDNVWTHDHVATAIGTLEGDSSLGAVYTSLSRRRPDGSELDVLGMPFDRGLLRWQPYVDANSVVVRRSSNVDFSVVPRNKSTLPKEDWDYVWRLSRRAKIAHIPSVTVHYTVNPDSYYTSWNGWGAKPGAQ